MPEVRDLRTEDRAIWQPLWDGYLSFYRAELEPATTDDVFARLCAQHAGMLGRRRAGRAPRGR